MKTICLSKIIKKTMIEASKTKKIAFAKANWAVSDYALNRVSIKFLQRINTCERKDEFYLIHLCVDMVEPLYGKKLTLTDIYLGVVFLYYSLNVMEQCEDWLKTSMLKKQAAKYDQVMKMITELSTSDVIFNGDNLSSRVRRMLMGLDDDYKFNFF